jgi:hypothetical protein
MNLFATCPSCTVEVWGWQRMCSGCVAASRLSADSVVPRSPAEIQERCTAKATVRDGISQELRVATTRRPFTHLLRHAAVSGAVGLSALEEPAGAMARVRMRRSRRRRRQELKAASLR